MVFDNLSHPPRPDTGRPSLRASAGRPTPRLHRTPRPDSVNSFSSDGSTTTETGNDISGTLTTTASDTNTATSTETVTDQGASDSSNTHTSDASTTTEFDNTTSGSYSLGTTDSSTATTTDVTTDQGTSDSGNTFTSDFHTTTETGNTASGGHTVTSSESATSTAQDSGSDDRGSFSSTSTDTDVTTSTDSGGDYSGADGATTTTTLTSTWQQSGGDGTAGYSQGVSDSATTTVTESSNDDSGADTTTTTATDGSSVQETGGYRGVSYTIRESDSSGTTEQDTANDDTGSDSTSVTTATSSSLSETDNSIGASYSLGETVTSGHTDQTSADELTGSWGGTFTAGTTTTTQESSSHAGTTSTFTETVTDSSNGPESGNNLTGAFSSTGLAGTTTTTLQDQGTDGGGSFSVGETDTLTYGGSRTGDSVTGSYTASLAATSDSYTMTEVESGFSLGESGSNAPTTQEQGNTVTGAYSRGVTGTDSYSLGETGTHTAGSYTEGVQGSDGYTLTETGNNATQEFTRTETGGGAYARTDSGPGATLGSGGGSTGYTIQESGDWRAGLLSQSETGADRYSLLETFDNVSDAGVGTTPGHLNFSPAGLPFGDDPPRLRAEDIPSRCEPPRVCAEELSRCAPPLRISSDEQGATKLSENPWSAGQAKPFAVAPAPRAVPPQQKFSPQTEGDVVAAQLAPIAKILQPVNPGAASKVGEMISGLTAAGDYERYQDAYWKAGVSGGWWRAAVATAWTRLPFASTAAKWKEATEGRSVGSWDYGRELSKEERIQLAVEATTEVAAQLLLAKITGGAKGPPKVGEPLPGGAVVGEVEGALKPGVVGKPAAGLGQAAEGDLAGQGPRMAGRSRGSRGTGDWHDAARQHAGDPALEGLDGAARNAKLKEILQAERDAKLAKEQAARAKQAPQRAAKTRLEDAVSVKGKGGEVYRVLKDPSGQDVKIYGQSERSGSTTPGHSEAMNHQVERMVESGEYKEIYLQKSWKTATGEARAESLQPDVIGVRRNGTVDAWEVESKTDIEKGVDLKGRLKEGMDSLPLGRRGSTSVIPPEPPPNP